MILVTGGTGLVGSHLLYFLLQENEKVRAIHRAKSDLNSVKKIFALYTSDVDSLYNKIEWVEASVNDIPALTEAFKNITRVYHCAAIISFDPSEYKLLKKVNIEGTANIVNISLANDIKKLCYVSSVSTLGSNIVDKYISEETPWNSDEKNSVYAITKYGAEMEVWRGTQEGLDAVIVNPGVILGTSPNNDGSGVIVGLGAKGIPFYPSGSMGIVDIKDVVRAMILLMNSEIKNEQYIVVGENITFKELLSKLAVLFEKKPPTKKLSKGIMLFISGIDWLLNKLFNIKRKVVKANVLSMFTNTAYNTDKLRNQFDFKYTPTDETLKRIVTEIKQASI
ncbi:NAD-dependent epimerase/dehydratase family protein [Aequorivita sp. KMM 9714]|uniref:NAD-dependent epimerase/dehydratase family protein n=1 Tax=Aequorivita sp. KMM 9714 TaxID=2707173 RepID=UPI0013ECF090|nr:NAD-dependent epimerase/dehydratase family protein [Aequorivita sp. KMM 9714]NGX82736.1 NAD-dependent epimerase/dehydratase family protein [Aequorivita sp. KMM 9714]